MPMKVTAIEGAQSTTFGWEGIADYIRWIKGIFNGLGHFVLALADAPAAVKNITIFLSFFLVLEAAQYSATGLTTYRQMKQGPVYGPPHRPALEPKMFYSFHKVGKSFGLNFPLWRLSELSRHDLEELIISNAPKHIHEGLKKYLQLSFHFAQKYQVDPFWVLSIMWVESHFDPEIKSPVNASGLMQIMPATSYWLNHLLDRTIEPDLAYELTKDPIHNVQLGTFYLKRLLKRFHGNYVHSTVAYNMGPGYTKRRLRWGLPVGKKNLYLDKVRRAYRRLTRAPNRYFSQRAPQYINTYVYSSRYDALPEVNSFHFGKVLVTLSH